MQCWAEFSVPVGRHPARVWILQLRNNSAPQEPAVRMLLLFEQAPKKRLYKAREPGPLARPTQSSEVIPCV